MKDHILTLADWAGTVSSPSTKEYRGWNIPDWHEILVAIGERDMIII